MDETSSGYGEESPVLCKYPQICKEDSDLNLEELHKDLLQHLKKTKTISRADLKLYLEQVTKMNPYSHRHRWLIQKIRGLLKYIMKKRAAFQDSVVKGEIIIYEKSGLWAKSSVVSIPIDASNSTFDMPSSMLSNNNFEAMDTNCGQKSSYNYSQDLFSGAAESLHNFGQENYHILKELTSFTENKDNMFKMPLLVDTNIDKVYEMHENLEEKYNSLVSITPSLSHVVTETMDESLKIENNFVSEYKVKPDEVDKYLNTTIFDVAEENENFVKEIEDIKKYIQEIVLNLLHLKLEDARYSPKILDNKNITTLNESTGSTASTRLKTYQSEDNFKIIRETCAKFRQNLEKKDLGFLKDFLNSP